MSCVLGVLLAVIERGVSVCNLDSCPNAYVADVQGKGQVVDTSMVHTFWCDMLTAAGKRLVLSC